LEFLQIIVSLREIDHIGYNKWSLGHGSVWKQCP